MCLEWWMGYHPSNLCKFLDCEHYVDAGNAKGRKRIFLKNYLTIRF